MNGAECSRDSEWRRKTGRVRVRRRAPRGRRAARSRRRRQESEAAVCTCCQNSLRYNGGVYHELVIGRCDENTTKESNYCGEETTERTKELKVTSDTLHKKKKKKKVYRLGGAAVVLEQELGEQAGQE
ncbi:hypothetical protein GBF38_008485 [Nibea albiflora]|uniref:Uncharacterized protein n=1 Tax=Nibea albiflora TaxID=240163 RepID=A0ACB7EYE0_NIBAL|nr:hypothetical protein GBF38_008485 [Nibea albiflora]